MKKICIAALAATLALGTMITAQAADTTEPTYPKQYRSVNGGRLRGLKSPAGGAWEELADGTWKYHFAEGLEATDYWLEIDGTWYYFGHDNIMQTGWVKDDGNWYYMDLETGALFTGWHEIGGKWYYFHEEGDGFKGTLMVDCVTPDGHTVDVNDPEIRKRFFHVIIMNSTGIPLPRPSRGSSDFSHRPRSSPGSCSHGLTQSPRPRRNRIPRLPQRDDPLKIRHSDSAP